MKSKSIDMTSGSIMKGLLSLTVPIMIMNVAQSVFGLVDMAILKAFGYESAVGAVGACGMLITLCTSLLIGIAAGANVVVARYIGSGQKRRAEVAITTSLIFAVAAGIFLLTVGVIFAEKFLVMTNCHYTLLPDATTYFRIYFCGTPMLMLYNFSASMLRATGDTKRPMYFLFIGCICKVVFTVLFINLWSRGVESVGAATVIANLVTCGLSTMTLLKNKSVVDVSLSNIRFDFGELKSILYNGVPAGIQSSLYAFANVVITSAVNSFGPDATSGIAIANQYDGILYQISYAPSLATIPYVAQNMGAGNFERVRKTLICSMLITLSFGASLGSLSAIFSRELSYLLTASPAVAEYSVQKMVIVSSTYFICGINEVLGGTLKGMGRPIAPAITSFVYLCMLRIVWVYFVFPHVRNMTFLYAVWPIGWTLSGITLLVILVSRYPSKKINQC